jgi:nicotinate phosphoribosyltransferase
MDKIIKFKQASTKYNFKLSDFGLRRRFSGDWQDHVVKTFADYCPEFFVGTSNVYLAKKYNIKPIGTFAHEWFGGIQGENIRISEVQKYALDIWAKEYRGELGIALSDNFGFRAFLNDFDKYFAKLFDGCRHDSGCPFKWGEMLINHFKSLGIDPKTKTACWSDSLDPDKAIELAKTFHDRINVTFGIGTNLTNDVGFKPVSIVMKVVESNGKPVCKISDAPGKGMCKDSQYVEYVKQQYNYKSIDED